MEKERIKEMESLALQSMTEKGIVLWHGLLEVNSRAVEDYRAKRVCREVSALKTAKTVTKKLLIVTNPISWSEMTDLLVCFPELNETGISEILTFAEEFSSFDKGININLVATGQSIQMPKRCLALMGKSTVYNVGFLLLFNTRERHYSYLLSI